MLKITVTALLFVLLILDESVPRFTVPIIISIVIGLTARLGYEWGKNTLTLKNAVIRILYAFCLSYLLMFLWQDLKPKYNIVYFIAGVCALSMEIINESLKVGEIGFKNWLRNKVNSLIGKNDRV